MHVPQQSIPSTEFRKRLRGRPPPCSEMATARERPISCTKNQPFKKDAHVHTTACMFAPTATLACQQKLSSTALLHQRIHSALGASTARLYTSVRCPATRAPRPFYVPEKPDLNGHQRIKKKQIPEKNNRFWSFSRILFRKYSIACSLCTSYFTFHISVRKLPEFFSSRPTVLRTG